MDPLNDLATKRIVILGAGVVGLSTAYRLVELYEQSNPGGNRLNIEILSDKFLQETTSDGAGGLFRPDDRFIPGVPKEIAGRWGKESFKFYDKLLFSELGGVAGIFQASGYQMFDDERPDPSYKDYIYQFRHLTQDELGQFPRRFKYGYFATTICVDPRTYMKYLTDFLLSRQVKFTVRKVGTQEEFLAQNDYDVVINCLGFGAVGFCNDKKMVPIRGQMIRVHAPWIKHFYYTDDNCYIIPNINTICLGGTRQVNNFSTQVDPADRQEILRRCKELCPSLEKATIEWEWCGLRPHREPIRVEKDTVVRGDGKSVIIIHNYGHGGNGISLSRGTAMHAVELLLENSLNRSTLNSKL